MSSLNEILLMDSKKRLNVKGDEEQLYRAFINLIKNSEDSIAEKRDKNSKFKGKISVEIHHDNDYIFITLIDNGTGIKDIANIMTPYYTTKKDGTGLGLPIVSKIINEHFGDIAITNNNPGVKCIITFPKSK